MNRLLTGLYWGDWKDIAIKTESLSLSLTPQGDGENRNVTARAVGQYRLIWEADVQHCVAIATENEGEKEGEREREREGGDGERREWRGQTAKEN